MADYQYNPNVEQWKDIPGFPGYEVSDHGRVRSYWRNIGPPGRQIIENIPQRILRQPIDSTGYNQVYIASLGNIRTHRLVASIFCGPCPPGHECRHLDGNRQNNHQPNLCWGTRKENITDAITHGTHIGIPHPIGEKNQASKLSKQQVIEIRKLYLLGSSQSDLGKMFSVSKQAIHSAVHRKTWKHIP